MQVTNLQTSAMDFFGEVVEGNGERPRCTIPPGATVDVPEVIWARYEGRADVLAMNGTKIAIGGATKNEIANLAPEAQMELIRIAQHQLEFDRREFESTMVQVRKEIDTRTREVEARESEVNAKMALLEQEKAANTDMSVRRRKRA